MVVVIVIVSMQLMKILDCKCDDVQMIGWMVNVIIIVITKLEYF